MKRLNFPFEQRSLEQVDRIQTFARSEDPHIFGIIGDSLIARAEQIAILESRLNIVGFVAVTSLLQMNSELSITSQVFERVYVGPLAKVSDHVILNTSSIVEHQAQIEEHSFIGPGAAILGSARIGSHSFIGANATVLPGIQICSGVTVGAGSCVTRDISHQGTYVGSPARRVT